MKNLATIQKIKSLSPIPGADKIEAARFHSVDWCAVVKKGDFQPEQLVVFIVPDTILPFNPWNDFLRDKKDPSKEIRLKTIRLKKQISQGLVLPLSVLGDWPSDIREGEDISDRMGIRHYEKLVPENMAGDVYGAFPTNLFPKTDELNILSYPAAIAELQYIGGPYTITCKLDGASFSCYFNENHFGVCGRNWEYKIESSCAYINIAKKYNLQEKLTSLGESLAIQAELIGPKINGGHTGIKENDLRVFDMYSIKDRRYLNFTEMVLKCAKLGLTPVPLIDMGVNFQYDIPMLKIMCKRNYDGTDLPIEGMVIRPLEPKLSNVLEGRLSFKVINEEFLLKYGE